MDSRGVVAVRKWFLLHKSLSDALMWIFQQVILNVFERVEGEVQNEKMYD